MAYMSIGKFSKEIGVTAQTLRNWHKEGVLIPELITDSGTRYYSEKQLDKFKIKSDYNSIENKLDLVLKNTEYIIKVLGKHDNEKS